MNAHPGAVAAGRAVLGLAIALVGAAPAAAQPPPLDGPRVLAVDTSRDSVVQVVVGTPPGAELPGFAVEIDGVERPATVRPVDADELAVGIVVDNPASLPEEDLRSLGTVAVDLVLAAPPGTALAVAGTAGPGPTLVTEAAGAVAAVSALRAPGRAQADPRSAVSSIIDTLGERPTVPPVLVLISSSAGTDAEIGAAIADRLGERPLVVQVLTLGPELPPWLAGVEPGPGAATVTTDTAELRRAARALGSGLSDLQIVNFAPEGVGGRPLTVRLQAPAEGRGPVRLVVAEEGDDDPAGGRGSPRLAGAEEGEGSGRARVAVVAVLSVAVVVLALAAVAGRRRAATQGPFRAGRTDGTRGDDSTAVAPAAAPPGAATPRTRQGGPTSVSLVAGAPPGGRPPRILLRAGTAPAGPPPAGRRPRTTLPGGTAPAVREAQLLAQLVDPDPTVRCWAASLAGRSAPSAVVRARLVSLLDDVEPVAEMAAYSLGEQGDAADDVVEGLARMARHHPADRCREAAVAALGALGAGLPTILAASQDPCVVVRRRAVLALAPFDGPEVDEALQRASRDDDPDVRRAATDLGRR